MLVQYTPISALSADEQHRLRSSGKALYEASSSTPYVHFEGKYIQREHLAAWIGIVAAASRQQLNG